MKAQVLTGIGQMEMRQVDDPVIGRDTDVLLKIEMVGVCGSDVHYYETGRIGSQVVQYPYIVGHECSATVADFFVFVVDNALFAGILWGSVINSLFNGNKHADQTADSKVARLGGCLAQ